MFFQILAVLSYFVNSQNDCRNYTSNQCLFTFDQISCAFAFCFSPPQNQTSLSQNWQTCVSQCCSVSNNSMPQSAASLKELCPNIAASEDEISAVEIGAIVAIALFIALCIFCFIVKKYGKYCPCVKEDITIGGIIKNDISEIDAIRRLRTNSFSENDNNLFLCKEDEKKGPNSAIFCSICLENSPNVQTDCGHSYHLACLCCWNKRSRSCPDCRAIMGKVKIICEKCFESRIVPSLSMDTELGSCRQCSAQ